MLIHQLQFTPMITPNFDSLSAIPRSGLFTLTESEWRILLSLASGETADTTSDRLCITAKSYHNYKHRIGEKLDCKGRGALELFAQAHAGLLRELASLLLRKSLGLRPLPPDQMPDINAGHTGSRSFVSKNESLLQNFNTSVFEGIKFCF